MKLQDELLAASAHCDYERDYRAIKKAAAQLDLYEAALREIEDGQFSNSPHEGKCLCHRCAIPAGGLRAIARKALNSTDTGA